MDILDYFNSIWRSLQQNHISGFLEVPVTAQTFDTHHGLFRAKICFWDSSYLIIDEIIDTTLGYPNVVRYSYSYLKNDTNIFRYDNAPHYPNLATFPHHKHIDSNEIPRASKQPTLNQVFKEINSILLKGDEL